MALFQYFKKSATVLPNPEGPLSDHNFILDYCEDVWSGAPPTLLSTLDRLHARGITFAAIVCDCTWA